MRLLGGYSKYFNKSHDRSGALFQGKFKAHVIDNEQYFSKIHSYVHMNDLVHDIPVEKKHLVRSSVKEYENQSYDLVSEKEAEKLLGVYQGNENFKKECMKVISIIREERGKTSLLEEDHLP